MHLSLPRRRRLGEAAPRLHHRKVLPYGMRAASSLTKATLHPVVQAKLKIGAPNDPYEQEADRVAHHVMRVADSEVAGEATSQVPMETAALSIQRMCSECAEEEESLQRKPIQDATNSLQISPVKQPVTAQFPCYNQTANIQRKAMKQEEEEPLEKQLGADLTPTITLDGEAGIQSLRGGGQPMSESERAFFEPRFGHDFSKVRIHSAARAVAFAQEAGAKAFTVGSDVVFGAGQYSPGTREGRRLMAHELTHVVQQQTETAPRSDSMRAPPIQRERRTPLISSTGQPSPPSIAINEIAHTHFISRSPLEEEECYTNKPKDGWGNLSDAAQRLPDVFNPNSGVFRNKAAAQYKIAFKDQSQPLYSDVIPFHSGNASGSEPLFKGLKSNTGFKVNGLEVARSIGQNASGEHSEKLMTIYGIQMMETLRSDSDIVESFEGYVFSLFSPCTEICVPALKNTLDDSTPQDPLRPDTQRINRQWWVDSRCVPSSLGGDFDLMSPPVTRNEVKVDEPNYERAKRLKLAAGDSLTDHNGWTKYSVIDSTPVGAGQTTPSPPSSTATSCPPRGSDGKVGKASGGKCHYDIPAEISEETCDNDPACTSPGPSSCACFCYDEGGHPTPCR